MPVYASLSFFGGSTKILLFKVIAQNNLYLRKYDIFLKFIHFYTVIFLEFWTIIIMNNFRVYVIIVGIN